MADVMWRDRRKKKEIRVIAKVDHIRIGKFDGTEFGHLTIEFVRTIAIISQASYR